MGWQGVFGEWIRERRRTLDLTRSELAQCAGCSVSALRKIEGSERRPSKQLAALLADCLGVLPDDRSAFVRAARGELPSDQLRVPFPASRPESEFPTSVSDLPIPATPLVGRESELAALGQLLRDPQCRLLTIVGPGGIGKTRLAIEAATRHQELFPDGACFVPLASLDSPAFLVSAIADALQLVLQGHVEPRAQLLGHLRGKRALLVLDNVEHLLAGVGLFGELLECAPSAKLLVTSRERLNLHGEWVFEVQGLPVPSPDQAEYAEEYSAVALFVQSAQRAQAGFELRTEERPSVVRICRAVEGMPLAIELAAAWVSLLSCREIAEEIERGLDFLTTTMRDVPERQRSLRAAFDHSWSLLSVNERRVLVGLAVFQGGFGREAAEQVAGATLPILLALACKSLVRRVENERYDLHQVVRQYALLHLESDAQSEAVRERHAGFYLALLSDREAALKGAAQGEALQELTDEIGNVWAAWTWAVERGKFALLGQALRCFGWFHEMRGWFREGIERLDQVVQALRVSPEDEGWQEVLGRALAQQGLLLFRQGRFDRAQAVFEESLAILRPLGDPDPLLDPLTFSGIIMFLNGETERAQSLVGESLACARVANDPWFEAYGLYNQGSIAALLLNRQSVAYEEMLEGLKIWRMLGDRRMTALGLNWISPTVIKLGRYGEAEAYLQESLALCRQVGDRWGMGTAYRHLGLAALAQGNLAQAQALLRQSLDQFAGFITGWDVAQSLIYLAEATAAAGDRSEGRRTYLKALHLSTEAQAACQVLDILAGLADLLARAGDAERALALALRVLSHEVSTQEARDRAEHLRAQLASQLTSQQIQAVEARLQVESLDALVTGLLSASLIDPCEGAATRSGGLHRDEALS
jgi:predicted ATPase/transcriptional regulator with XRE-family HTH domain